MVNLILADHSLKKEIDDVNAHPKHWINFENGMLDVVTMELKQHNPAYLSINQIPHIYRVVDAKESAVAEFLHGIMPDASDREVFLEYAGYCMTTDTFL